MGHMQASWCAQGQVWGHEAMGVYLHHILEWSAGTWDSEKLLEDRGARGIGPIYTTMGLAQYIQQYNEVTKHNEVTANARRSSKLATELRAEPTQRPEDQPRWLTYGTSTSVSVHRCNRVDQVKTADVRVERGSEELGRPADRGRWWHKSAAGDAYGVRYSRRVSRVWASKPGQRFRGTDDTWRHRGVRVELKLPMRRRGGRRI